MPEKTIPDAGKQFAGRILRMKTIQASIRKESQNEFNHPLPQAAFGSGKILPVYSLASQAEEQFERPEQLETPDDSRQGLPGKLKTSAETLSGFSLDSVRVHYNSDKPARVNALAYTRGNEIFVAPGQEKHLAHETWHVIQQAQGRVEADISLEGMGVNTDRDLEQEADRMGKAVLQDSRRIPGNNVTKTPVHTRSGRTFRPAKLGWQNHMVIQCVGGQKFGIRVKENQDSETAREGLEKLRQIQAGYKDEIKRQKNAAKDTFQLAGPKDIQSQTDYANALAMAEMSPKGLFDRFVGTGLTHKGNDIYYKKGSEPEIEIATIRVGADAYEIKPMAAGEPGFGKVYQRHTLDGMSKQEYVKVGDSMLRRYAFRGITPQERKAYKEDKPLHPLNRGREDQAQRGYGFSPAGKKIPRTKGETDLGWLNSKANTRLGAMPDNPRLRSFVQTRKGAGKYFSATSTHKPITSNHGAAFTGYGRIKIDLARVPEKNILHHYKQPGFSAAEISAGVGKRQPTQKLEDETTRANETVIRNREIVLDEIPNEAATIVEETQDRQDYEAEFIKIYPGLFQAAYNQAIQQSGFHFQNAASPAVNNFPWDEGHYTAGQARTDARQKANVEGRAAAAPKIAFARAYANAYKGSFKQAALRSRGFLRIPYQQRRNHRIVVPGDSEVGLIPDGDSLDAARLAGNAAGQVDGANYWPGA